MRNRIAIIVDGGFLRRKLEWKLKKFPKPQDIVIYCGQLLQDHRFKEDELFRIYYYDSQPLTETLTNPIDGSLIDLSKSQLAVDNQALIDGLRMKEDFAVRLGSLVCHGWKIGKSCFQNFASRIQPGSPPTARFSTRDLVPDITQKGVDIKIGLDMALLATKRIVEKIILITGDSDFIPAMKLVRREGIKVYLDTAGHGVYASLKEHADGLLNGFSYKKPKK